MSDSYVQVQPDSSGKKVDTSELAVGTATVERQRIVMADGSTAEAIAPVTRDDPDSRDYGLVVRIAPGGSDFNTTHDLLVQILDKLDQLVELNLKE